MSHNILTKVFKNDPEIGQTHSVIIDFITLTLKDLSCHSFVVGLLTTKLPNNFILEEVNDPDIESKLKRTLFNKGLIRR